MAIYSDFLFSIVAGVETPWVGVWVRLVNNDSAVAYVSDAATNALGRFTFTTKPPGGSYTVYTGPTNTGAWTGTGETGRIVPQVFGPSTVIAPIPNGVDDTTVLNSLIGTANTWVQLQAGTYLTSAPLTPASGVVIAGVSRKMTIIKGLASWTAGAVNSGLFNFTSASSLYSGNAFLDLQLDTTAVTYGANHIDAIHQDGSGSQIQHLLCRNLWLEMTANSNSQGIEFEGLGGLAGGGTSFDLTFDTIYAHNGAGTVLLYLNAVHANSICHTVFIQNIVSLVDISGVGDDRVTIAGNQPSGAGNPEFRDVSIRGVYTTITSNVASGLVSGVKVDSGTTGGAYVHNISIRDVFHRNYGTLTGCSPIVFFLGVSSYLQDVFVDNVYAVNTKSIQLRLKRFEADPSITITNVHMKGCTDIFCLEVYAASAPAGDESVIIRNVSLHSSLGVSGNTPTGILLASGAAGQGGSGIVLIDACELESLSVGVTNNLSEALGTQATAWTNIKIANTDMTGVATPANLIGAYQYENFNAIDLLNSANMVLQFGATSQLQLNSGAQAVGTIQATGTPNWATYGEFRIGAVGGSGHLISSAASTPTTSTLGANVTSVTFTGNDTRGTIAIVMAGALAANTKIATCTYGVTYGASAPVVHLSNQTSGVGLANVNFYRLAVSTGVSFDLAANQALAAGTYTVGYVVIG